jgi:uncharacterized membrane protein YesL
MGVTGWAGRLYSISEWIMRLAYVNLLWIFFTLAGLILFGFVPATVGMFTVVRKWIMGEEDIPVFKTFWQAYRSEFINANLLGLYLVMIGFIIYFDLRFFQAQNGILFLVLFYVSIGIFFIYLTSLLFFFPVFVHYDLKGVKYIKQSFLIAISHPFQSILMVVGVLAGYYIMMLFPGLIPFFGVSVLAYVLMSMAYRIFTKIERDCR